MLVIHAGIVSTIPNFFYLLVKTKLFIYMDDQFRICKTCNDSKPINDFYIYERKSNGDGLRRKICKECFIKRELDRYNVKVGKVIRIPVEEKKVPTIVSELEIEVFEDNPDYKRCKMCEKYKSTSEFYQNKQNGYYHSRCKTCHLEYSNKRQHEYFQKKWETCGGSERILPKPGQFLDRFQEEQVTWLLELIGWSRNEDKIFTKEGIKEVVDGKIVWPKIKKEQKVIKLRKSRIQITEDDVRNIIELRNSGLVYRDIAVMYGCSKTTIGEILRKHNNN